MDKIFMVITMILMAINRIMLVMVVTCKSSVITTSPLFTLARQSTCSMLRMLSKIRASFKV